MKTQTKTAVHKNFQIIFNSDVYNGEILDTAVKILPAFGEDNICVIAGIDINKFKKEFAELIDKYKI